MKTQIKPNNVKQQWVTGDKLSENDRQHVLAAFVHRFTKDHHPAWAVPDLVNGISYPVQYESDREWLLNTRFAVKKNGRLDRRVTMCEGMPTWPDNPEFRKS